MTVDERSRLGLYEAAREKLGDDEATTLMELLPPVGWADVATKQDLALLEARMQHGFEMIDQRFESIDQRFEMVDQRFESIDQRFESIDQRFDAQSNEIVNRVVLWMVPIVLAGTAMSAGIAAAITSLG